VPWFKDELKALYIDSDFFFSTDTLEWADALFELILDLELAEENPISLSNGSGRGNNLES